MDATFRCPLVLLVGFLGAGKTSFLRTIIPLIGAHGVSASVVIHDYQNAGIDAGTLAGLTQLVNAVSGNCVCCGAREELLDTLYQTEVAAPGVMLIETSGTTDPLDLIEILALDERTRHYTAPVQLSVIDAKRWQKRFWSNALEREQFQTATHYHLGWQDKATPARADDVRTQLQTQNPGAQFVTPQSFADFLASVAKGNTALPTVSAPPGTASASPPESRPDAAAALQTVRRPSLAHSFACVEIRLPAQLSRVRLENWLSSLPKEVVRAKGAVRLDDRPGSWVFQKVEGSRDIMFIPLPQHPKTGATMLLIGPALDGEALAAGAREALGSETIRLAPARH
ncbi:MAG: GTP-binding protein [Candidatus Methylacidiphilales bacterium]